MLRLLIKMPTRGRAKQFLSLLPQYYANLSGRVPVRFVIVHDSDDASMCAASTQRALAKFPLLSVVSGKHESKVIACNAGTPPLDTWDIMMLASDDMVPVQFGYDRVIVTEMAKHFPDLDGVLWFNDGYAGRRLNTLPVVGVRYYSRTRYIYHPDYVSLWCDNEFTYVAERLGKQVYIDDPIMRHDHPANVKGVKRDALYDRNEEFYARDKGVFELRAGAGFGLKVRRGAAL